MGYAPYITASYYRMLYEYESSNNSNSRLARYFYCEYVRHLERYFHYCYRTISSSVLFTQNPCPQPLPSSLNREEHFTPYRQLVTVKNRDDIPSIDQPTFETIKQADLWLANTEPLIVIVINGEARAYPLQILMWHEIINDEVQGVPIAVTYCPLCNSAFVFSREVNNRIYEFGTSGLLRFSNLVMYDRTTDSLWQQFTGEAIEGVLTGSQLQFIPSNVFSFEDFYTNYPDGVVLSKNTGYLRDYGQNPYVNYDQIGNTPFLYNGPIDNRLPMLERVVGVWVNGIYKAYPFRLFNSHEVINDKISDQSIVIFFKKGMNSPLNLPSIATSKLIGSTSVFSPKVRGVNLQFYSSREEFIDQDTGSKWSLSGEALEGPLKGEKLTWLVHGDPFWFAWSAFYPNTSIYI